MIITTSLYGPYVLLCNHNFHNSLQCKWTHRNTSKCADMSRTNTVVILEFQELDRDQHELSTCKCDIRVRVHSWTPSETVWQDKITKDTTGLHENTFSHLWSIFSAQMSSEHVFCLISFSADTLFPQCSGLDPSAGGVLNTALLSQGWTRHIHFLLKTENNRVYWVEVNLQLNGTKQRWKCQKVAAIRRAT